METVYVVICDDWSGEPNNGELSDIIGVASTIENARRLMELEFQFQIDDGDWKYEPEIQKLDDDHWNLESYHFRIEEHRFSSI